LKYTRAARFKRDYKALPGTHKDKFRDAVRRFHEGAEAAARGESNPWPNSLRVKRVKGTRGIWELTWSMDEPDGRATGEWTEIDRDRGVRWRRLGDHDVLSDP